MLPAPATVFDRLGELIADGTVFELPWRDHAATRVPGYGSALIIGIVLGLVRRRRSLRSAVGSMITGLQTMPSIAWFPLAILLLAR